MVLVFKDILTGGELYSDEYKYENHPEFGASVVVI